MRQTRQNVSKNDRKKDSMCNIPLFPAFLKNENRERYFCSRARCCAIDIKKLFLLLTSMTFPCIHVTWCICECVGVRAQFSDAFN